MGNGAGRFRESDKGVKGEAQLELVDIALSDVVEESVQ